MTARERMLIEALDQFVSNLEDKIYQYGAAGDDRIMLHEAQAMLDELDGRRANTEDTED